MKFVVTTNKGYWIWVVGLIISSVVTMLMPKFPFWEFNIFWLGGHTGHWVKRHYRNRLDNEKDI